MVVKTQVLELRVNGVLEFRLIRESGFFNDKELSLKLVDEKIENRTK